MQLAVCDFRRPIRNRVLVTPDSMKLPRSKSVFEHTLRRRGVCDNLVLCAQAPSKPAERWWTAPGPDGGTGLARKKSAQDHGKSQKFCPGDGESWRLRKEHGVEASGEAEVHDRLSGSCCVWTSSCEKMWERFHNQESKREKQDTARGSWSKRCKTKRQEKKEEKDK